MRRLMAVTLVAFALGAFGAWIASATASTSSGDSCSVTGEGDSFTIAISIPRGAPRQGGFAVGASGTTVTLIVIPGVSGDDTGAHLPPATTLAQIDQSALSTGQTSASVQTAGDFSGTFTVVPVRFPAMSYLRPITCAVPVSTTPSNAFSPHGTPIWSQAVRGWQESVSVPGPGVLSFHSAESHPLIDSNGIVVQHGGDVTLTIKPTRQGTAALAGHGSITVPLILIFTPARRGAPATKTLTVTLRASR